MNLNHIQQIALEMGIRKEQVQATAELLEQDSTVPFIARRQKGNGCRSGARLPGLACGGPVIR